MSEITAVPLRPIKRGVLTTLWVGIALCLIVAALWAWNSTSAQVAAAMSPEQFLAANGKKQGVVTTASGLQYKVLTAGNGPKPTPADVTQVDYEGKLVTGETFDSSARNGGPVAMPVAAVVPGFSEALQLMPKGSSYRFWIPPHLGYGERTNGPIPGNSVLVFDVTLHDIAPLPPGMLGNAAPQM